MRTDTQKGVTMIRRTFTTMSVLAVCGLAGIVDPGCNLPRAQSAINVPAGNDKPVLIDGHQSEDEWSDAITIDGEDSVKIFLKQYQDSVFLFVASPFRRMPYTDMYLSFSGGTLMHLHASAQLGERTLYDASWTDADSPFRWGFTDSWYANEMRFDRALAVKLVTENPQRDRTLMQLETTYPFDGFEFQLHRERFRRSVWRLRAESHSIMPDERDVVIPSNAADIAQVLL